jgi:hypothetical protein
MATVIVCVSKLVLHNHLPLHAGFKMTWNEASHLQSLSLVELDDPLFGFAWFDAQCQQVIARSVIVPA